MLHRGKTGEAIEAGKTIEQVVRNGLCTGCGTCVGICPEDALQMVISNSKGIYVPQLDEERCNECGLCFEVCPGHSVDFGALNLEIFGREPEDILIGNYLNCYVGHASDYDIRYNSASGGLVTALLIFALEQGIIDGALVTKMSEDNPLETQPFIARTREEIISAAKSKYCPVPANIALEEIIKEDGKFAVVGLPCHIQGVRKAQMVDKRLKDKIALCLGLFCSSNRTFGASEYILRRARIKPEEVARFDYRGEGMPGQFTATLRDGQRYSFPFLEYYVQLLRSFFKPTRCTLCSDHSCELSDISFGDVSLPEFRDDSVGISSVISRSETGDRILKQAAYAGIMELSDISRDRLMKSKIGSFYRKKKHLNASCRLFGLLHRPVPNNNTVLLKPNLLSYVYAAFLYAEIYVSARQRLWGLIALLSALLRGGGSLLGWVERKIADLRNLA